MKFYSLIFPYGKHAIQLLDQWYLAPWRHMDKKQPVRFFFLKLLISWKLRHAKCLTREKIRFNKRRFRQSNRPTDSNYSWEWNSFFPFIFNLLLALTTKVKILTEVLKFVTLFYINLFGRIFSGLSYSRESSKYTRSERYKRTYTKTNTQTMIKIGRLTIVRRKKTCCLTIFRKKRR